MEPAASEGDRGNDRSPSTGGGATRAAFFGPFDLATHEKIAFVMRLHAGQEAAYRERHDALFPDVVALLKEAGVSDYSIHFDAESRLLFAVLWRRRDHAMSALADHPAMQRWWAHMADIMETHPSNEPVARPLATLFHLP